MTHQCYCICHSMSGVQHVVACCHACEFCHARIIMGGMENHLEKCELAKLHAQLDEERRSATSATKNRLSSCADK